MTALDPQSRMELLKQLEPPEGFTLTDAVGTTYSLDLLALLILPVGFTHFELRGVGDSAAEAEPLKVLEAVRSIGDRMTVFCQASQIKAAATHRKLFGLLESSIVPAKAPHPAGSFHAKTWALRFSNSYGEVKYRFICLSRNLTFDRSWDTVVTLEGDFRADRVKSFPRSKPLVEFYSGLQQCATQRLSQAHRTRLDRIAGEIGRVEFEPFDDFEDLAFHALGLGKQSSPPLSGRIDRLAVFSPFIDAQFLKEHRSNVDLIVSRADAFDELGPKACEGLNCRVLALPPTAEVDPDAEDEAVANSPPPSVRASDLHAKIYLIEAGWNCTLLTGSANATNRGLERNVEFLVALTGKKSVVGIDAILAAADKSGLHSVLEPYTPVALDDAEKSRRARERELNKWCQQIANQAWRIEVITSAETGKRALEVTCSGANGLRPPEGMSASLVPNGINGALSVAIGEAAAGVSFPIADESAETAFLQVSATSGSGEELIRRHFTILATLVGTAEGRLTRLVTSLIQQHGGVVEWLFLLLGDTEREGGIGTDSDQAGRGATTRRSTKAAGLFEHLVRAAAASPETLQIAEAAVAQIDTGSDSEEVDAVKELLATLNGGRHAAT